MCCEIACARNRLLAGFGVKALWCKGFLVQRPSGVKIAWCKSWWSKRLLASGVNDFGVKPFPEKVVWRKKNWCKSFCCKEFGFESKCLGCKRVLV